MFKVKITFKFSMFPSSNGFHQVSILVGAAQPVLLGLGHSACYQLRVL